MFGHEAALFVPSGTMGNQIGLRLVCEPGQEVLCDSEAHIVTYEMGAAAVLFGISTRTVVSGGRGGWVGRRIAGGWTPTSSSTRCARTATGT